MPRPGTQEPVLRNMRTHSHKLRELHIWRCGSLAINL